MLVNLGWILQLYRFLLVVKLKDGKKRNLREGGKKGMEEEFDEES
jgi:hypothetical protein